MSLLTNFGFPYLFIAYFINHLMMVKQNDVSKDIYNEPRYFDTSNSVVSNLFWAMPHLGISKIQTPLCELPYSLFYSKSKGACPAYAPPKYCHAPPKYFHALPVGWGMCTTLGVAGLIDCVYLQCAGRPNNTASNKGQYDPKIIFRIPWYVRRRKKKLNNDARHGFSVVWSSRC